MSDPRWHGQRLEQARARADHLGGCVVRSWGPTEPGERARGPLGYWSEDERSPFLRTAEELVYLAPAGGA